jgi:hypothetical protein
MFGFIVCYIIGFSIMGIAFGHLTQALYGWMFIGGGFVILGFVGVLFILYDDYDEIDED